ncbi:hypothetical protein CYMTET_50748 [Cymbomonas tetramitiformis]|uniref:Histone-lysine N-methyltransferase n=1 Tax=Cymbomonas tetramitiformis TaxID=36881 RepID=A0AAE0ESH7_9CHLO|nr:hypothetical protein CYMTET_50748 [Cymbomonas tetramitiformis]
MKAEPPLKARKRKHSEMRGADAAGPVDESRAGTLLRMDDEALDRSQGESLPPMPDNPLTVFEKLLEEVGGGNNRTLMAQAADKLIPWLATAGEQLLKSVRILTLKARDKKRNEMEALQRKLKPAMFYTAGPVSTSRLEQLQGLSECMLCHTPVLLPESRSEHWPGGQLDYSEQLGLAIAVCCGRHLTKCAAEPRPDCLDLTQTPAKVVHSNCLLWSPMAYPNPADMEEFRVESATKIESVQWEITRVKKLNCSVCGMKNANLGCLLDSCNFKAHYPCVRDSACWTDVTSYELWCPKITTCARHVQLFNKIASPELLQRYMPSAARAPPQTRLAGIADAAGPSEPPAQRPRARTRCILDEDLSNGKEKVPVAVVVDDPDDEEGLRGPPKFEYVTERIGLERHGLDHNHDRCLGCACPESGCCTLEESKEVTCEPCIHIQSFREAVQRERGSAKGLMGFDNKSLCNRVLYNQNRELIVPLAKEIKGKGVPGGFIFECSHLCRCGDKCHNRVLQRGLQLRLEVFYTKNKGWGVRTTEPIARGAFVVEYFGEVITDQEAEDRGKGYDEDHCSYLYDLNRLDVEENHKHSSNFVLDAMIFGNISRFINHSCEPNLRPIQVLYDSMDESMPHIGLYAINSIKAGTELTYNYGYELLTHTRLDCRCGTKTCRGRLY